MLFLYISEDRKVKSEETAYYAKNEKTDTRMIYYVAQLPNGTSIVVRTVDVNVVVIALGYFHQLQNKKIWVESDIQSKNNLRHIISNYLTNLKSYPAKLCHSAMSSLGVITHFHSTEKGR